MAWFRMVWLAWKGLARLGIAGQCKAGLGIGSLVDLAVLYGPFDPALELATSGSIGLD
jgi:hypothetical protein